MASETRTVRSYELALTDDDDGQHLGVESFGNGEAVVWIHGGKDGAHGVDLDRRKVLALHAFLGFLLEQP